VKQLTQSIQRTGHVYLHAWELIQHVAKRGQRWQLPTEGYCNEVHEQTPTSLCTLYSDPPACVMRVHDRLDDMQGSLWNASEQADTLQRAT